MGSTTEARLHISNHKGEEWMVIQEATDPRCPYCGRPVVTGDYVQGKEGKYHSACTEPPTLDRKDRLGYPVWIIPPYLRYPPNPFITYDANSTGTSAFTPNAPFSDGTTCVKP